MNEQEWLLGTQILCMLDLLKKQETLEPLIVPGSSYYLGKSISDRKLRLFTCACATYLLDTLDKDFAEILRPEIKLSCCRADGEISSITLEIARGNAKIEAMSLADVYQGESKNTAFHILIGCHWVSLADATAAAVGMPQHLSFQKIMTYKDMATLLRDIAGNPFRFITLDRRMCRVCGIFEDQNKKRCRVCSGEIYTMRSCLSANVLSVANAIYEDGCFQDLPVLHDALMDAGCTHEPVLQHCRGKSPCPTGVQRKCCCAEWCRDCLGESWVPTTISCTVCRGTGGSTDGQKPDWCPCFACCGRNETAAQHYRGCWVVDLILEKE